MKKVYQAVNVKRVGAISQVVAKSGDYMDCNKNFESKTFDEAGGCKIKR
jgi:hypothetical protein